MRYAQQSSGRRGCSDTLWDKQLEDLIFVFATFSFPAILIVFDLTLSVFKRLVLT